MCEGRPEMRDEVLIGGASGFWGEAAHATAQLLDVAGLDFLVYDYLAEITMSILARARARDPALGYATDFVTEAMAPNLAAIAAGGVRVISNAGGVNAAACAEALGKAIAEAGLGLTVAVVEGDDLTVRAAEYAGRAEMFSGAAFPDPAKIASINAYLGAFPIAAALDAGADIVVTGRCVDSAATLGACIHRFGWSATDLDRLAGGSLAGHILECGPQATGGNFTDWRAAGDIADIGYPVAAVAADGTFTVSKPARTTGLVSPATVAEQMLYEIGDPQSYVLPDVTCDFSRVTLADDGPDRVRVSGARGRGPSGRLKVSATFMDGYRAGHMLAFNGVEARAKAEAFAAAGLERARRRLRALNAADFAETCVEITGGRPGKGPYEEVMLKAAVRHRDARAVGIFLKEVMGGALATPPGLSLFTGGGRPKPSPVVRLFSFLTDREDAPARVGVAGRDIDFAPPAAPPPTAAPPSTRPPAAPEQAVRLVARPLAALAWARSGDKGDAANIGVIARRAEYLPWIWRGLDEARIAEIFAATLKGRVERFHLPGVSAMNIVMHEVLGGGGVVSLLNDAQGKGFAQRLLAAPIEVPESIAPRGGA
jgi:hypothetical protein